MKTTLHAYWFDISKPKDAQAWEELEATLKAQGLTCFEAWGGNSFHLPKLDGVTVELDTAHIFNNQWNTSAPEKLRVFDWALDYTTSPIKQGHYLAQTPEMRTLRDNTAVCGYCGEQEPLAKGYTFCPHCLGSKYLTAETLHLTRMQPVSADRSRDKLTQAEYDHLMPLFVKAQTEGVTERDKAAIARARAAVVAKYEAAKSNASTEYHGMLWLLDHGLRTDNVIYYNHTGRFCFGWRTPLSGELLSRTLDILAEFPFDYDIKKAEVSV